MWRQIKQLIAEVNKTNWHKRNIKLVTTGWERGSISNCARGYNLIILPIGICTN